MAPSGNLVNNSDSLIGLLTAQCSELEKLLALAREETEAARDGKFLRVWDIVSERAAIGKRLETFQRQITDLRAVLETKGEKVVQYDITNRVIEFANQTLVQDQKTRLLLTASRDETVATLKNLERSHHNTNAYMRENAKGLSYNRSL
jgi:hypothetical protein